MVWFVITKMGKKISRSHEAGGLNLYGGVFLLGNAAIGFLVVVVAIVLAFSFPIVGIPLLIFLVFYCVKEWRKQGNQSSNTPTGDSPQIEAVGICSPSFSVNFHTQSDYTDYSRFFQRWDDSYDKKLGYEWFRVCVERVKFPIYDSVGMRLLDIRKARDMTQVEAARNIGISVSTLSSYENDYTEPSNSSYKSLSAGYYVPLNFIKYGYADDLTEQVKLYRLFGESEYLHSLSLSVTAASRLFPEMLTESDRSICILINDMLDLKLDLFNEQANAKEKLYQAVKAEILKKLAEQEIIQKDLYALYGENRLFAQSAVKELYDNGIITKEKQGNTFVLRLSNLSDTENKEEQYNE